MAAINEHPEQDHRLILFGERIREARSLQGWTQFKLASELDLAGTGPLVEWEKGRRRPRITTLQKLASVLDVAYEEEVYWRGLTGYLPSASVPSKHQILTGLRPYIEILDQLPYPAYIADIRYLPWLGNAFASSWITFPDASGRPSAQSINILRLLFDSSLGFTRRVKGIEAVQVEQINRYKGFNFMHRHEAYYINTSARMKQHLPPSDFTRFDQLWRRAHSLGSATAGFPSLASVRLGVLHVQCQSLNEDVSIPYQAVTRSIPEFGDFFIISQLIPQDTALFEACIKQVNYRRENSLCLWDTVDIDDLLDRYRSDTDHG